MDPWAREPAGEPYFDRRTQAWILTRYNDVLAALREPLLVPATPGATGPAVPVDEAAHAAFRIQAFRALSSGWLCELEARYEPLAQAMAAELPAGPLDLISQFAAPWCRKVADLAVEVPPSQRDRMAELSARIFASACEPYDARLTNDSHRAVADLAGKLGEAAAFQVQMYVALAHSLPAFLGNSWLAMFQQDIEWPELPAMDELLRVAGPAKAQFRQALGAVEIGKCQIGRDESVILRLDAANRDPAQFPAPDRLQFDRPVSHVALGGGAHACVAGMLIKPAAASATRALFRRFRFLGFDAEPANSFAVRYLHALRVHAEVREGASGPVFCL